MAITIARQNNLGFTVFRFLDGTPLIRDVNHALVMVYFYDLQQVL